MEAGPRRATSMLEATKKRCTSMREATTMRCTSMRELDGSRPGEADARVRCVRRRGCVTLPAMPHGPRLALSLLLALSFSISCNGGGEATDSEATSGDEDEWGDWDDEGSEPTVESHEGAIERIGISGPDKPWGEMTHDEQEWYMIGKVLPIMKEVFGRHDAERFAPSSYGCETCHGPDMREVEYRMPASNQYRVPNRGTPAWDSMVRIFPDMVRFMEEDVTPTMGTLLGIENYTCTHCHPSAAPPEPAPAPARRNRRGRR